MVFTFSVLFALECTADEKTEWGQFRGPNGQGVASSKTATPVVFDRTHNLLWKCSLVKGLSSPCIAGQRIFLTGYNSGNLKTFCIDRSTGKILWQKSVEAVKKERTHRINSQATSTATTDGERVYVYFGSYGLVCYDIDGNEKWNRKLPVPRNMFGTAVSPVVMKDKLIFCSDNSFGSYLEAIDGETGKTIWKKDRSRFKSGWSTPALRSANGVDEILVYGIWWLTAYNLKDGSERWSVPGLADEPCITPVMGDGPVFVTSYNMKTNLEVIGLSKFTELLKQYDKDNDGELTREEVKSNKSILSRFDADGEGDHPFRGFFRYLDEDKSGKLTEKEWGKMIAFVNGFKHANALVAIKPGTPGNKNAEVVWQHPRGVPECPSPLYYEGRIYLVKNGGIFSCLDAKTGKLHYQKRLRSGGPYYASPVVCNGKMYTTSARGVITVIEAGDRFKVLATNDLKERIMATPALVDGKVYVRTEKALYAFGSGE